MKVKKIKEKNVTTKKIKSEKVKNKKVKIDGNKKVLKSKKNLSLIIILLSIIILIVILFGFNKFSNNSFKDNGSLNNIQKKVTVSFVSDDEIVNQFEINKGEKISNIEVLEKEHYEFVGWYLDDDIFDFNKSIYRDITLTAVWKKKVYTITFNSTGGTSISKQNVEYNDKVKKPSSPTKVGYTFVEWQYENESYNFSNSVKSDLILTAVWKKKVYTVSFDTNGGKEVTTQKIEYGNKATIPLDPTKEGYEFIEWQLNGKKYDFASKVTQNIKLTSKWKKITFNIGDVVSVGNENFYVIRVYNNEVTLFAKYTLGPDYHQSSKENLVQFATQNSWGYGGEITRIPNGEVKIYLDKYLEYLNNLTNNKILRINLISQSFIKSFGLNPLHEYCYTHSKIFHNGQDYWTSTGKEGSSYDIVAISGTRCMDYNIRYSGKLGVRPVIVMNKDYF